MKTLLMEKEIYKIHKGDYISARTKVHIGDIVKQGFRLYKCVDKIVFKINTCPHCGSKNSFHKRIMNVNGKSYNGKIHTVHFDNVYKTYIIKNKNCILFHKIDYCLNCCKEFPIEMFCYYRVYLKNLFK